MIKPLYDYETGKLVDFYQKSKDETREFERGEKSKYKQSIHIDKSLYETVSLDGERLNDSIDRLLKLYGNTLIVLENGEPAWLDTKPGLILYKRRGGRDGYPVYKSEMMEPGYGFVDILFKGKKISRKSKASPKRSSRKSSPKRASRKSSPKRSKASPKRASRKSSRASRKSKASSKQASRRSSSGTHWEPKPGYSEKYSKVFKISEKFDHDLESFVSKFSKIAKLNAGQKKEMYQEMEKYCWRVINRHTKDWRHKV